MKTGGHSAPPSDLPIFREVLEDPVVRRRITEYLGGLDLKSATCRFLGSLNPVNPSRFERHPPASLSALLRGNREFARSLDDRESLLIHLDVEYVAFDDPTTPFLDPQRCFSLQEPLVRVIEEELLALGIRYLHVVTGQGHHFVWKVRRSSPVARAIAELAIRPPHPRESAADAQFQHLALMMEYLAQRIKRKAAPRCRVPVEITAQSIGRGPGGRREMLSIDISEYGDPLTSRMIRIPYTAYRKPWLSGLLASRGVPGFCTLPLHEMHVFQLIEARGDPDAVIELAHRAGTGIPDQESGTRRLLDAYQCSALARFHRSFHRNGVTPENQPLPPLPPCARHVFDHPNDLLLKPGGMQLVTRCLLAAGWPPARIAQLVGSIFDDPSHQWRGQWRNYRPALRAEFYVRLIAGQIATGIERGIDFNCVSQQEKGFCWNACGCSLGGIHRRIYQKQTPVPP